MRLTSIERNVQKIKNVIVGRSLRLRTPLFEMLA